MHFRESVWDDSEPNYSPGIKRVRDHYIWRPPAKYLKAGYAIKGIRLEGVVGDDLTLERARHCRVLTRELLKWYDGETKGRAEGTWGWLIGRYLHDDDSPIQDVQPSTRANYIKMLTKIEDGIKDVRLADTNHARLRLWIRTMNENGRSTHYIKKWFTHWGLTLSYGVMLGNSDCQRIKAIRSEMRIGNPPTRSSILTRDQVNAIVQEADLREMQHVSLSLLFRFEFMLRGVSVYGEWEPSEGRTGGLQHQGRTWVKGLTWEMFDQDLTKFKTVISKTARSLPEPYEFSLIDVPHLRDRLEAISPEERVGPVIKLPNGRPPANGIVARGFKAIVRDLGLPDTLRISDSRAGGITEAKSMVDPFTLRDAAQHTQISTTDRYVRDRSAAANRVVRLRGEKK